MQMPLTLSDAEIRRLRDHEVLLTHVGITTLTSEEFRASADRIVKKFANDNRYQTFTTRVLLSKVKKDAQKAALAVEQQKASDAAAAEARKLEQIEAAKNKAKLERIAVADANHQFVAQDVQVYVLQWAAHEPDRRDDLQKV